jgi:tetratricopeptide (TPR) repeat protein
MEKRIRISISKVMFILITGLVTGLMITGCAGRQSAYVLPELSQKGDATKVESFMKEGDDHYVLRENTKSLEAAIQSWEKAVEIDPQNQTALIKLSIACYWMGNGHLKEKDAKISYFHKGAQYGERAMALNPEFKSLMEQGKKDYECLDVLGKKELPAVYWAYCNLGRWAVNQGFVSILKYKKKLKTFIDWVVKTDEEFQFAGGHRSIAVYYAKAPSFAGGDLEKSKYHFDRSLEIAPNYFTTKLLMAEFYAYKTQDREMFVRLLNEVLDEDPAVLPNDVPEQKISQEKARILLGKADDMFE